MKPFILENASENIGWEMAAILSKEILVSVISQQYIKLYSVGRMGAREQNIWVKVQVRGPEILRKMVHYCKEYCAYLVSLCLHEQGGDTIVDGWPLFDCNFNVLPIWFSHTATIASTWQPVPEPINGVTGTWLSCFVTCDWLRAIVRLHCDVMITTSTTKTWWSSRTLGVDLSCLRKIICHQNTMLMRWKIFKFKDKGIRLSAGEIHLEIVPPLSCKDWAP